jgi:hypothetical protein
MLVYMFILMCISTLLLLQISARLGRIAGALERMEGRPAEAVVLPLRVIETLQRRDEPDVDYKARVMGPGLH